MITMNEEGAIQRVVRNLRRDVPGATIAIVDSSTDHTPEIAREEGIDVVRQFPPEGYGPAMVRALTYPNRPIVVTLDCDDTYPTETVGELVAMIRSGYDVVGTSAASLRQALGDAVVQLCCQPRLQPDGLAVVLTTDSRRTHRHARLPSGGDPRLFLAG